MDLLSFASSGLVVPNTPRTTGRYVLCRDAWRHHIALNRRIATTIVKEFRNPDMNGSPSEEQTHDRDLDITAETCPMTFVRTRLALDRMEPGQILRLALKGDEPRRNVPRTATEQGHAVLSATETADGVLTLLIRKKS
jgi:TusA-related sulfurtransferase